MTATAQSWANMTYDQQTFWIYFYTFVPLAALMGLWYLLAYHFTDYEPALQFRLLVAWFRERRWRDHLPARYSKRPAEFPRPAGPATVSPPAVAAPGTPPVSPRNGRRVPGTYLDPRPPRPPAVRPGMA